MTITPYVAAAASTGLPEMLLARIVTVLVAETKALNTKPAAGAAGKDIITSSPTAAPVTVIVRSAEAPEAIEGKFREAEFDKTLVMVAPEPEIKPFKDRTGPVKVVSAMITPCKCSTFSCSRCIVCWVSLQELNIPVPDVFIPLNSFSCNTFLDKMNYPPEVDYEVHY